MGADVRALIASGINAANGKPQRVKATGNMTTVAASSLVDGETFTIIPRNPAVDSWVVFEFDKNASGASASGRRVITLTGSETADQVRDAIVTAINAAAECGVTAASGGAATVTLTARVPGAEFNVAMKDTVAAGGFASATLSGGALSGISLAPFSACESLALNIWSGSTASGTVATEAWVWVYDAYRDRWYPDGNGTSTTRGWANDGQAIDEIDTDYAAFSGWVGPYPQYDRIYVEFRNVTGTTPIFSAELVGSYGRAGR